MADKKARPQRSTGFTGSDGASPPVNAGDQLKYSWSLGGGDTVEPQPNPSGATPSPQTWIHGAQPTTPPNANPAAMRGYTRNAPYMEDIVNSPQGIIEELRLLGYAPEDDVVSQYRKRVLMSALRDIYNINPYDVGPGYVMGKSMAPVTPGSR